MDASQLNYTERVHLGPKHKFRIFLFVEVSKIPRNTPNIIFVEWSRMHASQLWYPEIVHSGLNTSFASLYVPKVSVMLWNTPKHHFCSNGVEWILHNFGTPKWCIQARTQVFHLSYVSKVSEMLRNTPKHHFGSNGVEWMLPHLGICRGQP
jgi:hypothetical protein